EAGDWARSKTPDESGGLFAARSAHPRLVPAANSASVHRGRGRSNGRGRGWHSDRPCGEQARSRSIHSSDGGEGCGSGGRVRVSLPNDSPRQPSTGGKRVEQFRLESRIDVLFHWHHHREFAHQNGQVIQSEDAKKKHSGIVVVSGCAANL